MILVNILVIFIGMEINFEEADCSITEGDSRYPIIRLLYRRTQNSFTVTLSPVNITMAVSPAGFNARAFITSENIDEATSGEGLAAVTIYEFSGV